MTEFPLRPEVIEAAAKALYEFRHRDEIYGIDRSWEAAAAPGAHPVRRLRAAEARAEAEATVQAAWRELGYDC